MKKWLLVVNPMSAGGRTQKRIPAIMKALENNTNFNIEVRETREKNHATAIVQEAASQGIDGIISLGGDGTHNEVVNGFFNEEAELRNPEMALAVLPAGSGGDFARMLYPSRKPTIASESLRDATIQMIDVGCCTLRKTSDVRFFLNVASMGMGAEVVRSANQGKKIFGGRITYQFELFKSAIRYKQQSVRLEIDHHPKDTQKIRSIAIANGQFAGGGMKIAPNATIQDGLLDVIVIGEMSSLATIFHSFKLHKGKHLQLKQVQSYQGNIINAELDASATQSVYIELDGEEVGSLPADFKVLPKSLPFLMPQRISNA